MNTTANITNVNRIIFLFVLLKNLTENCRARGQMRRSENDVEDGGSLEWREKFDHRMMTQ